MHSPYDLAGRRPPRNVSARPLPASRAALLAAALLGAAQLACGAGSQSNGNPAATNPPPADGTVSVDAKLLGFTLSTDTVTAGPVTFVVTNDDFLPHDFKLSGNGLDEQTTRLPPGDSDTLTLDLAAGTYTYICTVEGHSENMRGTLTVR